VKSGEDINYANEKGTLWFDNLDRNSFDMDKVDWMMQQLGYDQRKFVFWCPPGKTIDDLTEVSLEIHCKMMAVASVESKLLLLFVHLPDELEQQVKDELSQGGNSEDSEEEYHFQCESDEDPAWHDSDYDMNEDDALFADNVDDSEPDEMVEKGKHNAAAYAHVPGLDDINEDDLELPEEDDSERRHKSDSDDEEYKKKKKKKQEVYKFKPFNSAVDMHNPRSMLFCHFSCHFLPSIQPDYSHFLSKPVIFVIQDHIGIFLSFSTMDTTRVLSFDLQHGSQAEYPRSHIGITIAWFQIAYPGNNIAQTNNTPRTQLSYYRENTQETI
jgi:hypothetical protein